MWKVKFCQALCLVVFLGGIDNAFSDQGKKSNQVEALESKDFWESFEVVANTDVQIDELEALDRAALEKSSDTANFASNSSTTKTEKSKSDHATKNTMSETIK